MGETILICDVLDRLGIARALVGLEVTAPMGVLILWWVDALATAAGVATCGGTFALGRMTWLQRVVVLRGG